MVSDNFFMMTILATITVTVTITITVTVTVTVTITITITKTNMKMKMITTTMLYFTAITIYPMKIIFCVMDVFTS